MASKKSLEAAAATSGMFTAAAKETKQAAGEKKRELQTFSVRIDSDLIKKWKTYTTVEKYGEMGKLTEAALTEYMNRHKLTGDKLKKYETLIEL